MSFFGYSKRDWREVTGEVRCYDQMREGGPEPGRFPQGRGNRSPQGN